MADDQQDDIRTSRHDDLLPRRVRAGRCSTRAGGSAATNDSTNRATACGLIVLYPIAIVRFRVDRLSMRTMQALVGSLRSLAGIATALCRDSATATPPLFLAAGCRLLQFCFSCDRALGTSRSGRVPARTASGRAGPGLPGSARSVCVSTSPGRVVSGVRSRPNRGSTARRARTSRDRSVEPRRGGSNSWSAGRPLRSPSRPACGLGARSDRRRLRRRRRARQLRVHLRTDRT